MASVGAATPPNSGASQVGSTLKELQREAAAFVFAGLYAAGLLLVGLVPWYPVLVPAVLMYGLLVVAWAVRPWHYLASAWLLVIACLLVIWLVATQGRLELATYLIALPIGLAVWMISVCGGLALAVACTGVLLFAPAAFLPASGTLRIVTVMGVWGTVGLAWLIVRPVLTAFEWSWSSYEQSRRLLDEARDRQVLLKQAMADLAEANLQLARVNHLAQGLRQIAEEAKRAKEQFVTNVSHELRTPLNMIIGFSEMILQAPQAYGKKIPSTLLADLAVIQRNSQHLSNLIDDVLDLSQIEVGKMALTRERVAFREIVEAAVIAVRPLFDSRGLYLDAAVPDDTPPVFCDRTRIRQVLLNLLTNAGRFTEHGGVRIRVQRDEHAIVVSVADTGQGIAREDEARLFQPFQQLDGSLHRRHGGSGLGLSISKSFVELHGGEMWLESEKDVGTTFFFRLPIDPPVATEDAVSRWFSPYSEYQEHPRRPVLPVRTIADRLVVLETGDSLRRLLARYMDSIEIVPVANLDEACQEVSRGPAQALLINDPSVGDALQRLGRSQAASTGTPAIICSVPGIYEAADALGVSDYLVKPVSRDTLLGALERLELHGRTVLIVDDQPEALLLYRRMLASADRGYRVLRASNGQQALNILAEEHPDVILLDLVMPEMDGFQFLATRRDDPTLSEIPVVVISARDPSGQPIVSSALAVSLGEGLSMHHLLACIESLISILSTVKPPGDRAPTERQPDPPACG